METKKRRPRRPPRPCPACKPGIYCAACRGTGVLSKRVERNPRIDFMDRDGNVLLEPRGNWELGFRRSAHVNAASLRTRESDPAAREYVTNAQGAEGVATRSRKTKAPSDPEGGAYLRERGVSLVRVKDAALHGMTAHRGVLHPDEWLDEAEVVRQVEARMGYTLDEAREVYGRRGGGPLPKLLKERRGRLDGVMGKMARDGQVALLARVLGVPERNLQRAAERGRN